MHEHEQDVRTRRMIRDVMHAVADRGLRIWDSLGSQAPGRRPPCLPAVVAPEGAGRGDRGDDAFRIAWVEQDGVQTQPPRARLPRVSGVVLPQARKLSPTWFFVQGFPRVLL